MTTRRLPTEILPDVVGADRATLEERLARFVALALKWNRAIQFVATDDPVELFDRHVVDSLALAPHLEPGWRVVDVGAGGGFPAVVLAIARPDLALTALEPIHKKHAFLATAKRELGLPHLRPLAERDDVHRARADFAPYDAATSRATFAVPEWLERGLELVRPGGLVVAMEGREQHALPPGTRRVAYPLGDRQRALLLRRRDPA